MTRLLLLFFCALTLLACKREAPVPGGTPASADGSTPAATTPAAGPLQDVAEATPRYVIGISYPKSAAKYPGLAAVLQAYADTARKQLMEAVDGLGNDVPTAPYDLTLSFTELLDSPQLVAIAADGSSYTGGAHGAPLIARFVWLPQQQKLLTAKELVPTTAGWQAISDFVREQLHTALSQRLDADHVDPADRIDLSKSASKVIDEGTEPKPESFAEFEPLVDSNGRLTALRFVFPPYQVGSYADGTQTVEVPAEVLLPHVAPAYRGLFRGG